MKKYIFTALIVLMTACNLDTKPTASTSPKTIFDNTKAAATAINGMSKLMNRQYISSQGYSGEAGIKLFYGNYPGSHFYCDLTGWANTINMRYTTSDSHRQDYYAWFYYYKLIDNANTFIENIDNASGAESDKEFLKAQAYTFRAHSYMMLCQIYGFRWKDADKREEDVLVLKTKGNIDQRPLSPITKIYEQIYEDLEQAIALYEKNPTKKRKYFYEPNVNVAYATFARAALNKEDYANAAKYARLARANHPLMSNKEYLSGFSEVNNEWIWGAYSSAEENLHFYAFHAYMGYNSTATAVRKHPKCMSSDLYAMIPDTDIRKDLFLNAEGIKCTGLSKITDNAFIKKVREEKPDLTDKHYIFRFMNFKFKATEMPGVGHVNFIRSAEMYLTEAEAEYFLGNETKAQKLLEELTQSRDSQYTCTAKGEELFNEIKKYRNIELWGEGFDAFDLKRWGDVRYRRDFKDGGVFPTKLAECPTPEDNNYWTYVTPRKEVDFNQAIGGGADVGEEEEEED